MRNIIAIILLTLLAVNSTAQELENKIPKNADVVIAARGNSIFDLISMTELNNSALGKEILKDVNRKKENKKTSLSELGFNLKSNAYYFLQNTDSIAYHGFVVELTNQKAFMENLSSYKKEKIKVVNGYNTIKSYGGEITLWNDDHLFFINGEVSRSYIKNNKKRLEKVTGKESRYRIKKELSKKWNDDKVSDFLALKTSQSLVSSIAFQKAKAKGSVMTFWVRDYGSLINSFIGSFSRSFRKYGKYISLQNIGDAYGINQVIGNLFFDKEVARFELDMYVNDNVKDSYKKIYGKKMDKNLIRSFNHDEVLGFAGVSFNTEAVLIEYPHLMTSMYGSILPKFKEEISVVSDLISLVLDEEAIGELLTGDALFVVNDVVEKEVEYTTYKYDDDYKRTKVTKKKNELLPEASLLIGSKRKDLMNKFFRLAKKHNLIKEVVNGVFEFEAKKTKIPFKFYATVQNNVMAFTNSKEKAIALQRKTLLSKSNKYKKMLTKNVSVFYMDMKNVLAKIPVELKSGKAEAKAFNFAKNNVKDAYFKVSNIKRGKIHSEIGISTYGMQENTLKTFLTLINELSK